MGWDWELLDGPDTITEGPVWDGAGLIYTAINHNEIRRYDPATGEIGILYADSGEANGLALGPDWSNDHIVVITSVAASHGDHAARRALLRGGGR